MIDKKASWRGVGRALWMLALLAILPSALAKAQEFGSGRLLIAGTRLVASPESQTVPFETPTIVETHLEGYDTAHGTLPSDLRVLADLTGPEIQGVLTLETVPNEPLRIPSFSLKGEYRVDNIRLVEGSDLLAYAEPRSAAVLVTEILITKVTSRALTLDEIRSHGIVVGDSFKAYNFTFGFAVAGEVFDYNVPVLWSPAQEVAHFLGVESGGGAPARFAPPRMQAFTMVLRGDGPGGATGGCSSLEGCEDDSAPPIPGVLVFPTDTRLLNQFFSIILLAQNGAPAGDRLVIRDLTAKISLPPGLRQAQTEPPTPLGVPVPVHVPGPDGKLGTSDDITFLIAQATGQAEFLAEGLREGTHIVTIDLDGILEGMPSGIRHLVGQARGAVIVRDPTLNITITHPEVVRTDEEYSLLLTISNTSTSPANSLSITLPPSRLSGAEVVGDNRRTIDTLLPGDSQVLEFRLRALRTGRVVASSARTDSHITPSFELTMGVGEAGIPLSPTSIILPRSTSSLPAQMVRDALRVIGLGFSLATAPAQALRAGLPQVERGTVDLRVEQLAQSGTLVDMGESLFDAASTLLCEWTGVRDQAWEWDVLRRTTNSGAAVAADLAQVLATEADRTSPSEMAERFAATTAFLPPHIVALASGENVQIELSSRTSGKQASGAASASERARDLPFADILDIGRAQFALVGVPEPGGYLARMRAPAGGSATLEVILPDGDGGQERLSWPAVQLGPLGVAVASVGGDGSLPVLQVDADGDGTFERTQSPASSAIAARPFAIVAAVQDTQTDPSGHVVNVLFSGDVDPDSIRVSDPTHFEISDKVSDGGHLALSPGVYAQAPTGRIVRVVFNNPLSPYRPQQLTLRGLRSSLGAELGEQTVDVAIRATMPGTLVEGRVIGPDGNPVPHAIVHLVETDYSDNPYLEDPCVVHQTAAVQADEQGHFLFDYVRQTECGGLFGLRASDASNHSGEADGRVRFIGETVRLDIVMLGRGSVHGKVTYADGTTPSGLQVIAFNPVFKEGRSARVDAVGNYEIGDLAVGSLTLAARDDQGSSVAASIELASAGASVVRDLTLPRRPTTPTGELRGQVVAPDGATPVVAAYVALYVAGDLVGVRRSATDGRFDFGLVPAGPAEIEAFSGETGVAGARFLFTLGADRVNQLTIRLLDQRGTVQGHVFRRSLTGVTPVDGAVVYVSGQPFHTTTDAQGAYSLEGIIAGLWNVVAVDVSQNTQAQAQVTLSDDGEVVLRDLYFEDQTRGGIAGEVLDFDGHPVVGATVHLRADEEHWFGEAFTGADGRFLLTDLAVGSYAVHGMKGAAGAFQGIDIRYPGEVPFVSLRFKKGSIHGTVKARNDSGALIGVRSIISYKTSVVRDGLVGPAYHATDIETDAQGNYQIADVLAGPYTITAINAFYGTRAAHDNMERDGEVKQHDFVFERNGAVRGTVFDYDGITPVAGARVVLRHPAFADYAVESDAAGHFAFELVPPTAYAFSVEASINQGMIYRVAQANLQPLAQGQELNVQLTLLKQGTITGQLQMASGQAVAGAFITLTEAQFPGRRLDVQTDVHGAFTFRNVFAGTASIAAQSLNGLGGKSAVVLVNEGEEKSVLIQLEEIGEIRGRVLSPVDGSPIAATSVKLLRGGRLFDATNSDQDGRFTFTILPLDNYQVRVLDLRTGRQGRKDGLVVAIDGQIVETEVVLDARGRVRGHFLEPNGTPVPGATVVMQTLGEVGFITYSSTDTEGAYEFAGIPQGRFQLAAHEPAGRRSASGRGEVVHEGEVIAIDLILEPSGSVTGTVIAPASGSAELFPNAAVFLYQGGELVGGSIDNPFHFDGVLAQPFEVWAQEQGGLHRGYTRAAIASEGEEVGVTVKLWPIGRARVSVVDGSGRPVPNADVHLVSNGNYGGWYHATADEQGIVLFQNVGGGPLATYAIDPLTQLSGSATGSIADEGDDAAVTIALQPSGRITARLLKADGVTPADVLGVLRSHSLTYFARTTSDGALEFPSVPVGDFAVNFYEQAGPGVQRAWGSLAANGAVAALGELVLDDRDPEIVSISPLDGATGVSVNAAVMIRFSEPMWPDPNGIIAVDVQNLTPTPGVGEPVDREWTPDHRGIVVRPHNGHWESFSTYRVILGRTEDLAGRSLERLTTSFTTVDSIPPQVRETQPRQDAANVPVDTQLRVRFSEDVVAESVQGSAFQLKDAATGAGLSTTLTFNADAREAVLTPVTPLLEDHLYLLAVQGVRDLSGNPMAEPFVLRFWTRDLTPPTVDSVAPPEGTVFTAGDIVHIAVAASDNQRVEKVDFTLQSVAAASTSSPFVWDATIQPVDVEQDVQLLVVASDAAGNHGTRTVIFHIKPLVDPDAPTLKILCPSDGARLAPGTYLDVSGQATDVQGLRRVEIFLNDNPTPVASTATSPFSYRLTAPATAKEGDRLRMRIVASDYSNKTAQETLEIPIVEGPILTGDFVLTTGNPVFEHRSVIVTGGTLTLEGHHTLRDLVLLGEARANHAITATTGEFKLELELDRDLYVGCAAGIDTEGRGYRQGDPGWSYPNTQTEGAHGMRPSHGGRGAGYNGSSPVYDSLFDPRDSGGGGVLDAGGGVIRIAAAGTVAIDGFATAGSRGAGGSVRLQGEHVLGLGWIHAEGRYGASGGRIALIGGTIDPELVGRAWAPGTGNGGAGTIYTRRGDQRYGDLTIDGAAYLQDFGQPTELLRVGDGLIDSAGESSVTDSAADFRHGLDGARVIFGSDSAHEWRIAGNEHHGKTLELDTTDAALPAVVGERYAGLYHFDNVVVRNGGSLWSHDRLVSESPPQVDASSLLLQGEYDAPDLSLAVDSPPQLGKPFSLTASTASPFGVQRLQIEVTGGVSYSATENLYSPQGHRTKWTFTVPSDPVAPGFTAHVTATDLRGHVAVRDYVATLPADTQAPTVHIQGSTEVKSGDDMSFSAWSSDDRGVHGLSMTVLGQTYSWPDGQTRYVSVKAPEVAVDTIVVSTAVASDVTGNQGAASMSTVIHPKLFKILAVLPAEGTTIAAGTQFRVDALAQSVRPVTMQVRVGEVVQTGGSEFTGFFVAPPAGQPGTFTVVASAADTSGATDTLVRTLNVAPPPQDLAPPTLSVVCPSASPLALSGGTQRFQLKVSDDFRVARVAAYVSGATVPSFQATDFPSGTGVSDVGVDVTLPSAPADTQVSVLIRAEDFAERATERTFSVRLVAGAPISVSAIAANDTQFDGAALVVQTPVEISGHHVFASLFAGSGATILQKPTSTTSVESVDLAVSGDAYLACGSQILATGRGYLGAEHAFVGAYTYPNQPAGAQGSGGGSQSAYGSLRAPKDPGAGGGSSGSTGRPGAVGGGVIQLSIAGDLLLDGDLAADGGFSTYGGGGAGGAIDVVARNIVGSGLVTARGGAGHLFIQEAGQFYSGSPGGGGKVHLKAHSVDPSLLGRATAASGFSAYSSPQGSDTGTIVVERDGSVNGDLLVRGADQPSLTILSALRGGFISSATTNSLTDTARYGTTYGSAGHEVVVNEDFGHTWLIDSAEQDPLRLDLNTSDFTGAAGDFYRGILRFDQVRVERGARVYSPDLLISGAAPSIDATSFLAPGNLSGPLLDGDLLRFEQSPFSLDLVVGPGAISDPDPPFSLRVVNRRTNDVAWIGTTNTGSTNTEEARGAIDGWAGDILEVRAFDNNSTVSVSVPSTPVLLTVPTGAAGLTGVAVAPITSIWSAAVDSRIVAVLGADDSDHLGISISRLGERRDAENAAWFLLPNLDTSSNISGMALVGDTLVVVAEGTVLFVDVTDPASPNLSPTDQIHLIDPQAGQVARLLTRGQRVLVLLSTGAIVEVDPAQRRTTAQVSLPSEVASSGLAYDDSLLWSIDGSVATAYDLSDLGHVHTKVFHAPATPPFVGQWVTPYVAWGHTLVLPAAAERDIPDGGFFTHRESSSARTEEFEVLSVLNADSSSLWTDDPATAPRDYHAAGLVVGDRILFGSGRYGRVETTNGVTRFHDEPRIQPQFPLSGLAVGGGYIWTDDYASHLRGYPVGPMRPWLESGLVQTSVDATGALVVGAPSAAIWQADRLSIRRGTATIEAPIAADGSFHAPLPGAQVGDELELRALDASGHGGNIVRLKVVAP